MFADFNDGVPTPTTYESMREAILREHPLPDGLPDAIRDRLTTAVDFVALAYEQAKLERLQFFGP